MFEMNEKYFLFNKMKNAYCATYHLNLMRNATYLIQGVLYVCNIHEDDNRPFNAKFCKAYCFIFCASLKNFHFSLNIDHIFCHFLVIVTFTVWKISLLFIHILGPMYIYRHLSWYRLFSNIRSKKREIALLQLSIYIVN